MTLLTRGDGTPFVIQAYRELLITHKRSMLLQEIRMLAEQQGQYLRLSKNKDQNIEAVFNNEPGYLLAESIWQYFGENEFERGNLDAGRLSWVFGREIKPVGLTFDPMSYEAVLRLDKSVSIDSFPRIFETLDV